MPELPEVRIMSDYINRNSKGREFSKLYYVERGNNPVDSKLIENFNVESTTNGKELLLRVYHDVADFQFSVFMGMSGNWKFIHTNEWKNTKFVRMRIDSIDGDSLLLYGGYMGPKYKLGGFTGVKRGPDPTKDFQLFKDNILNNIHKRIFDKPICEVLLNQEYFNGIGNYLRSTILYYLDANPFESARNIILKYPNILQLCKDIPNKSYQLNGGQLKDWKNPFDTDYDQFIDWVFYQKGLSCKDGTGRTFWYHEKWKDMCIY